MLGAGVAEVVAGTSGRPSTWASARSCPRPPCSGRPGPLKTVAPEAVRYGHSCVGGGAVVRARWWRPLAREVRAAVGVARVAAAVPEVVGARLAGVLARARGVRQRRRGRCCSVESLTRLLQSYQPSVGAGGGTAGARSRRALVGAQRAVGDAVAVGLLVAHAVRPAVVARRRAAARRSRTSTDPAVGRRRAGVRADPRRVRDVGLRVDRQARRVAQAHRVDLGLGLAAAALGAVEQVRAVGRRRRSAACTSCRRRPSASPRPASVSIGLKRSILPL